VDDALIKLGDNELTFELTYYDLGTSVIKLQYNSTGADYQNSEITRTDTKTWITKSVTLTDASLNNKQNNQADFRIMSDVYVRRVAIIKEQNTLAIEQIKQPDYNVKVVLNQGILRISVPDEMARADVNVYNLMGQLIYQTKMKQTKENFHFATNSNLYIVVVRSGNMIVSKKVLAL
jgi:hypothetical protein